MKMFDSLISNAIGLPKHVQAFLQEGKVLLPTVLLQSVAKRSLADSDMKLLEWKCTDKAFLLKLDLSRVQSPVRISEAEVAIEVVTVKLDSQQQTIIMRPKLLSATGDGVLSKVVLWVAKVFLQTLVQALLEKSLTVQTSQSVVKVQPCDDGMKVDLSELPEMRALLDLRPIPFINRGIFDVIHICGGSHTESGFAVHGKMSASVPKA